MKLIISKHVGKRKYQFEVEGKNLFELVEASQKLSFSDVYKCALCNSDNLYLTAYRTKEKGYEYVKLACAACRASITFGQPTKEPNTFYLRKQNGILDWKAYEKPKDNENGGETQPPDNFDEEE